MRPSLSEVMGELLLRAVSGSPGGSERGLVGRRVCPVFVQVAEVDERRLVHEPKGKDASPTARAAWI